jgi:hypothetical protein
MRVFSMAGGRFIGPKALAAACTGVLALAAVTFAGSSQAEVSALLIKAGSNAPGADGMCLQAANPVGEVERVDTNWCVHLVDADGRPAIDPDTGKPVPPSLPYQRWVYRANNLVNSTTNLCLEVLNGIWFDGAPVREFGCNPSEAQKWVVSPGVGTIHSLDGIYCLDRPGNNFGVQLQVYHCTPDNAAQQWTVVSQTF